MNERERLYRTMSRTGGIGIAAGTIVIATGITAGVLMVVSGAKLLLARRNINL